MGGGKGHSKELSQYAFIGIDLPTLFSIKEMA